MFICGAFSFKLINICLVFLYEFFIRIAFLFKVLALLYKIISLLPHFAFVFIRCLLVTNLGSLVSTLFHILQISLVEVIRGKPSYGFSYTCSRCSIDGITNDRNPANKELRNGSSGNCCCCRCQNALGRRFSNIQIKHATEADNHRDLYTVYKVPIPATVMWVDNPICNDFVCEWCTRKQELAMGVISKSE